MNAVFADTFFYLALLRRDDPARPRALAESRINRRIVTTDFIVLELGNACAHVDDRPDFLALLAGLRTSPRVEIVPLSPQLLQRGLDLFAKRGDKDWSLTDCVSFVVMEDFKIRAALTGDRHFQQAGFEALLL
ncbi:MAG TPA: PIN domain-containing protein [Verrucomicrobiae bacterium]